MCPRTLGVFGHGSWLGPVAPDLGSAPQLAGTGINDTETAATLDYLRWDIHRAVVEKIHHDDLCDPRRKQLTKPNTDLAEMPCGIAPRRLAVWASVRGHFFTSMIPWHGAMKLDLSPWATYCGHSW